MMEPNTQGFFTSAIFWKDLKSQALRVNKIQEQLNARLNLAQYGPGLETVVFVPIAQLPEHHNHPERVEFSRKKRMLSLYLPLDYNQVLAANEAQFLQLLAQRLLEGLDAAEVEKFPAFAGAVFRADVQKALAEYLA